MKKFLIVPTVLHGNADKTRVAPANLFAGGPNNLIPHAHRKKLCACHPEFFVFLILFAFSVTVFLPASSVFALPSHPNRAEIRKLDSASCEDGFSFAVMSDSHQSTTIFERIIDRIIDIKPDFAMTTGDFTNDGKPEEYEQFISQITRAEIPWFAVPGNHEYRTPDGHTSVNGPKRYEKIFGKQDFFFDHCGWRFIGLDVVSYDMLFPAQLSRLNKALRGHGGHSAVFMHYPPAVLKKWEEGIYKSNAERFMEILEENEAAYFFSGHIHIHDVNGIGPTTYIITGGAGGGMDSWLKPEDYYSPAGGAFHHFTLVTIDKNGNASHEVIRIEKNDPDAALMQHE